MLRSIMSRQAYMAKPYSGIRFPVSKILTGFRSMSTAEEQLMDDYEKKIFGILKESFQPKNLQVKDVSGGCGSMFAILVESEKFKGIPMIRLISQRSFKRRDFEMAWNSVENQVYLRRSIDEKRYMYIIITL